ncbi:MAG TPA: 2OG-Fe(II) oxygenase family protein [Steroidobacteraceae bacterium]|nr:2OG-Fe(II) oxygenase family protein [Steroidobacteraceae bacterium]
MRASAPETIPLIDAAPLLTADPAAWRVADDDLAAAAREIGFACVRGLPRAAAPGAEERSRLLAVFGLPELARRRLYRRKFAAENRNVYRGWFPLQSGHLTSKEGIDIGGDLVHGSAVTAKGDPLREPSPLPAEEDLPGWRAAAAAYYQAMERVATAIMRSLARSLGLRQGYFDASFERGLSTLRLLHYPPRSAEELATVDPEVWVQWHGTRRYLIGAPHTDSGFVTLLTQDGVAGLQARARSGAWIDVPPLEGTLVVNFGQVLEQWSGGRIRATEHRVLGSGRERFSIPFFYEARADAIIAPLPVDRQHLFAPFQYGDFLWRRMTSFVEFAGMERERGEQRES